MSFTPISHPGKYYMYLRDEYNKASDDGAQMTNEDTISDGSVTENDGQHKEKSPSK